MRLDTTEFSITLKPGNKFEQIVQKPFHISQASLKNPKKGVTFVYFETEEDEFLVCRLCSFVSAEALDINFQPRNKIVFKTYGSGTVILTCQNDNEKKLWDPAHGILLQKVIKSKKQCHFGDIPDEIICRILSFSSVEDILQFAQVSKRFEQIVTNDETLWQKINLSNRQELKRESLVSKGQNVAVANEKETGQKTKRQVKKRKFFADEY